MIKVKFILALLAALSLTALAHENKDSEQGVFIGVDTPPGKVVQAFHMALNTGNVDQARVLLAEDLTVYEGGGVERSADEYANHHMLSDMKYLAAVETKTIEQKVMVFGNVAISISRSHIQGTFNEKARDYEAMETIALENQNGQWLIKHIHWSH
ncbi:nuclear transport factor 2 family protein [Alteromonas sp. ASW11-36]|uniref:Nuclear transport factor 2 family protein n=1 Tax=Alteromonas arenosi TaxID=3055817 RepID=A0ABT7SVB1_9ALTE|nr:nuclear transport factor 2 family protein [Alteromonas sp. ASW11-36]MDM7859939.1 nuclear transport factor 2 family protein [Alteromonas sp. ASW11-36]